MDKNKGLNAKMTIIVERGMRCGCTSPHEQTWKWALALLLLLYYRDVPGAKVIYDKVQDFKKA